MRNIKKAYRDKSFELCREMIVSSLDELDDELELMLTDCCIGEAEQLIRHGRLRAACSLLDEALIHADNTIYSTVTQKNKVYVLFYFMKSISPALDSDVIDTDIGSDILHPSLFGDVLCKYITVIFGASDHGCADEMAHTVGGLISDEDKLFLAHIKARSFISCGEYRKAATVLRSIMDGDTVPQRILLYMCYGDMEKCCKEMEDYKGAYEASSNKMEMLEYMLMDA